MHPNHLGQIERGAKDLRVTTLLHILEAVEASPAELELARLGTERLRHGTSPQNPLSPTHAGELMDRLDEVQRLLLDIRATVHASERL